MEEMNIARSWGQKIDDQHTEDTGAYEAPCRGSYPSARRTTGDDDEYQQKHDKHQAPPAHRGYYPFSSTGYELVDKARFRGRRSYPFSSTDEYQHQQQKQMQQQQMPPAHHVLRGNNRKRWWCCWWGLSRVATHSRASSTTLPWEANSLGRRYNNYQAVFQSQDEVKQEEKRAPATTPCLPEPVTYI